MSFTPFFVTGAMAKVKVAGVTMAFCTDITYSIRVKHATPKVLGMFESFTIEPLAYDVNGNFRVIRYTKSLTEYLKTGPSTRVIDHYEAPGGLDADGNAVDGNLVPVYKDKNFGNRSGISFPGNADKFGNGIGAFTNAGTNGNKKALNSVAGSSMVNGRADQSLDPSKLYWPQFFDIEVFQTAQLLANGATDDGMLARLRNCRIVSSDFSLTKRGAAVQTFGFTACYADEDTFLVSESGLGQPQG